VLVERGAGAEAQFTDDAYQNSGATLVNSSADVFREADIVLKVRPPREGDAGAGKGDAEGKDGELEIVREGTTIVSFVYPAQNRDLVQKLQEKKATLFAMDLIPRISRAQVFDALRCVIVSPCPVLWLPVDDEDVGCS
jgi:NAD(P) transhydrogenase